MYHVKRAIRERLPARAAMLASQTWGMVRAPAYHGDEFACPCCGSELRRFLPVIPGAPDTICPRCGSFARHRLLWLYLHQRSDIFSTPRTVLDIAPERMLSKKLSSLEHVRYISADLESPRAMLKMDVTDIPFRDRYFDVVFCNHVLEHVPQDRVAMRELRRVLTDDGFAILQTPFDPALAVTEEDPSITTAAARHAAYGHPEHVRNYGRDFEDRLRDAGFGVQRDRFVHELAPEVVRRFGLDLTEDVLRCTRDPARAAGAADGAGSRPRLRLQAAE